MNSRRIMKERHKRWGTVSPWEAEWWSNGVAYCKTVEGKEKFESWMQRRWREETQEQLEICYGPPTLRWTPGRDTRFEPYYKAGAELGVAWQFVQATNIFCGRNGVCEPPRILPAPVRKRGESSSAWIARRSVAIKIGCKLYGVEWNEVQRIAYSEFDHIRDQMEVWRTEPEIFLERVLERAASTIVFPETPEAERFTQSCGDAFRHLLEFAQMRYAVWSQATSLFDSYKARGLNSATAAVRACRTDGDLLKQTSAVDAWCDRLSMCYRGYLLQAFTSSSYLRPYFHRTRGPDGISQIQTNYDYVDAHPLQNGTIETYLCTVLTDSTDHAMLRMSYVDIIAGLNQVFVQTPTERKKVTKEALDLLGDFATVCEFQEGMTHSSFGDALNAAASNTHRANDDAAEFASLSPIASSQIHDAVKEFVINRKGTVWAVYKTWAGCVWRLEPQPTLDRLIQSKNYAELYDWMWRGIDCALLLLAMDLDRVPGEVAKRFGLLDPYDAKRPLYSKSLLREQEKKAEDAKAEERRRLAAKVPEPYVSAIPLATPQDSMARAPPRFTEEGKKIKRKKGGGYGQAEELTMAPDSVDAAEPERKLPDLLPIDWKLNRKTVEIFHRLLGNEERGGQLRWGDFEKAMIQVGFEINQTEGSSVRFDPPAKGVHPITFHRPHPDPTMTPIIMKWVGARLKRCYGWTIATFRRDPAIED